MSKTYTLKVGINTWTIYGYKNYLKAKKRVERLIDCNKCHGSGGFSSGDFFNLGWCAWTRCIYCEGGKIERQMTRWFYV